MITGSFLFITSEMEFQEATAKGARVLITMAELDKPSSNNRMYRLAEGKSIAKSLIGKTIHFGATILGKHLNNVPTIGFVESAYQAGNKIKGIVRITAKEYVDAIKKGQKFLFSIGGIADFGETIKRGKEMVTRLYNAICTHLQMLPNDPNGAGFPTAKMHKVIEINESVMYTNLMVCEDGVCKILSGIQEEFEESKAFMDMVEAKVINMAIDDDIVATIKAIMKEPWVIFDKN